jgi:hypothetical protein
MALLVPDVGEVLLLGIAINNVANENLTLKLFVTDVTPAEANTAGSFTEMSAAGYVAKTLTKGSWSVANAAGVTTASYAEQTFTMTAATACYGYYIVGATSTTLYWAESFGSNYAIPAGGGDIKITPKITLE